MKSVFNRGERIEPGMTAPEPETCGPAAVDPPTERFQNADYRPVTIDLDDCSAVDVFRSFSVLRRAGADGVEGRVSQSGSGAHVRGWVCAAEFSPADVERLRLRAGDHSRRTRLDRTHKRKPPQVLFAGASDWFSDPEALCRELQTLAQLEVSER
jgi:hypothetical protein